MMSSVYAGQKLRKSRGYPSPLYGKSAYNDLFSSNDVFLLRSIDFINVNISYRRWSLLHSSRLLRHTVINFNNNFFSPDGIALQTAVNQKMTQLLIFFKHLTLYLKSDWSSHKLVMVHKICFTNHIINKSAIKSENGDKNFGSKFFLYWLFSLNA